MHFLNILEIFRLDMGQISSNLLKKAFATWQHAFLSTSIAFYGISGQACAEIKILRPTSLGFSIFLFFFLAFPFSPFLFFLLQWLTFYWACFQFKTFWESIIETGNFCLGVAMCRGRKFCSEFFTQLFEHFCAYLRLHWADHSDLGIIGKIFSSCRSWA